MKMNTIENEVDNVNAPKHYCSHPSGIECIQIAELLPFNLGSALKYLWRKGLKWDENEDTKKAIFYLRRQAKLNKEPTYTSFEYNKLDIYLSQIRGVDNDLWHIADVIINGTVGNWLSLADRLQRELQ